MRDRIQEVRRYLHRLPGSIGITLDDRATGAIWRNANAHTEYPAASTMKLAVMTDLLLRNQSGSIHLTATDWKEMYPALHTSNDTDAKDLWDRYEDGSFLRRIQAFGMTGAEFTSPVPNWGFMYCTPADLDHLMNYVLTKTPPSIRNYLVSQLQHVSAIDQQWGVWGAGPENHPGNKDGWEQDPSPYGTWIINTVGIRRPPPAIHPRHHVQPRQLRRERQHRLQIRHQQTHPDRRHALPGPAHHRPPPPALRRPLAPGRHTGSPNAPLTRAATNWSWSGRPS